MRSPAPVPLHSQIVLAFVFVAGSVLAQSGVNLQPPPHWRAAYDEPAAGTRLIRVMRPGWRVEPGPAGVFGDDGWQASGSYAVETTIVLLPPGPSSGVTATGAQAPYGLVLGGEGLDGRHPSYVAWLVRNDGQFAVIDVRGQSPRDVVPWQEHAAVSTWQEGDPGVARNVLRVDVGETEVAFEINDEPVASVPRVDLPLSGAVGIRAGEGIGLHVFRLDIGASRR